MKWVLLGLLVTVFLIGFIGGIVLLLMALILWQAPFVGVALVMLIVGLGAGYLATYIEE